VNGQGLRLSFKKGWQSTLDQQSLSIEQSDKAKAISFTNHQRYPLQANWIQVLFKVRYVNRTQGKSVSLKKLARPFALELQQSPVSYEGIDIVSHAILKIMYRTISKSTFDDQSR